jgi:ABC-type dipeptide/oligopeptide/nickel transport system permease component
LGFSLSRLIVSLVTFAISVALSFTLIRALPGHYNQDEVKLSSSRVETSWTRSWDRPDDSVAKVISERARYSLGLQILAILSLLTSSILIATAALKWRNVDLIVEKVLQIGVSSPALFLIPIFVYLFCLKLDWLPLRFENSLAGWLLPLIALILRPVCISSHLLLQEWKKEEDKNYFLAARAKGLSRLQVFYRHGLKNALLPYVSQFGTFLVQTLMGAILVETLFSFPGMGLLFVESIRGRDLPVVLWLTILFSFLVILVQNAIELLQHLLEPRSGGFS